MTRAALVMAAGLGFMSGTVLHCAAASSREIKAFGVASNLFHDASYVVAEARFGEFAAAYTNSTLRASAYLYQAEARYYQSNYAGAIGLLRSESVRAAAGDSLWQYDLWIARTFYQQGVLSATNKDQASAFSAFSEAAKGYDGLIQSPGTPIATKLEAAYGEALSYSQIPDWPAVIHLLGRSDSNFQVAAGQLPANEFALRGQLLLGEACLMDKQYDQGQAVLARVDPESLPGELKWKRQYLWCRVLLAGGKSAEALDASTNLVAYASRQQPMLAKSYALLGEICEQLQRWDEAVQAYANNLATNAPPPDLRRRALFKTVDLFLRAGRTPEAMQRLQWFIETWPQDEAIDLARLKLGELNLKAYYASRQGGAGPGDTNVLQAAETNLTRLILDFPQSARRGQAHLDLGWCNWAREQFADATNNFQAAAQRLPFGEDQAVARLKLADSQLRLGAYAPAISNYYLVTNYASLDRIKNGLFDNALYQILWAGIQSSNQAASDDAFNKIQSAYPDRLYGDRSYLLYGQDLTQRGGATNYVRAREVLAGLLGTFTNSAYRAQAQFALARTYEPDDLNSAIDLQAQWVTNYPGDPLLPQVEYELALDYGKIGQMTNALARFTSFVTRFPTNELAPLAENWIADYYFSQEDWANAEDNYKKVYQSQKAPLLMELGYHARLMAGKAKLARQAPKEARTWFEDLIKDTNTPPALMLEAYFQLGNTFYQLFLDNPNPTNDDSGSAIAAFGYITNHAPASVLAAPALGQIGNVSFQWASLQTNGQSGFSNAIAAYSAVLRTPGADVTNLNQAEVGLGHVYERLGDTNAALTHYLNVIPDYNVDLDTCDPVWIKEATVNAVGLYEKQGQWEQAANLCARVLRRVPSLRDALENRMKLDRAHIQAAQK